MRPGPHNNPEAFEPEPSPPTLQVGDIYYILFRHKWKILLCSLAGLLAAGALYTIKSPLYSSEAKLLVHYVVDARALPTGGGDVRIPDSRGESVMSAELEILGSFDLLREVAVAVGPGRILGGPSLLPVGAPGLLPLVGRTNVAGSEAAAAAQIRDRLKIGSPGRSGVIAVEFQHADPQVAQDVVRTLIDLYFEKHKEIHRASGLMDDVLAKKADEFRTRIREIEARLREVKSSNNVVSIEDTMKAHLNQISQIRTELFASRAELAEKQASLMRLTNVAAARIPTNTTASTNLTLATSNSPKLDEYRRIVGQLEFFLKREQELSTQYTGSNAVVRQIRTLVEDMQRQKKALEDEDPSLARAPVSNPSSPGVAAPVNDPVALATFQDTARVVALTAKIAELTNQLASVQKEAARVEAVENEIRELQRQKEVEETKYKTYSAGLEQAKIDETFGPGKLPNISRIQQPTPPGKDMKKFYKKLGMVAGGGIGAGLALAFLIELFLDQSVRRPSDLQRKLRLPVFLTVPRLRRIRSKRHLKEAARQASPGSETNGAPASSSLLPALKSIAATSSVLQPYCDALRDRLIHYFQKNNMTHKPKLVAVTGCGQGSGVSTVAAGLAASLSETGDGNVLLVDTNLAEGAAHPFYRGKLACGLNDVLKEELRGDAQIQDNLYVATASESDGALIKALPKRFSQLVPKLKASDYDYIIFDMPPVTQTSITSKLAGYMDMVLLVVESEKTGRAIVSEASDLLRESRANVATVLNKTHRYVPRWVHQEFE